MARPAPVATLVAVFAVAAVLWTWPLARHAADGYVEPTASPSDLAVADLYLTSWILAWDVHQLRRAPLRLFEANIFHPLPHTLALSEHLMAGALLVAPAQALSGNAVLGHNLLVLGSFVLGATGTALLVRDLGAGLGGALLGGGLWAFGPLRYAQVAHVHALSAHWLPFALLFLQRYLRGGRRRDGAAFVATLALTALSSVYYLYYGGLAVVTWMGLHAALRAPALPGTRRRAFALGGLALLLVVPAFLPYARVRAVYALAHDPAQAVRFSALGEQYLGALLAPGRLLERTAADGRLESPLLGPGFLALAALGVAWRRERAVTAYALLALVFALVSLGPEMRFRADGAALPGLHALLAAVVPGLEALRVPQRAATVALLGLAVLAGLGADALLRAARRRTLFPVAAGLAAAVATECRRPALHVWPEPSGREPPAAYRWLAGQPAAPVVELPMAGSAREARYMLRSTHHWRPLVNGYSGTFPARNYLQAVLARFPDAGALDLLARLRVRWIVLHLAELGRRQRDACASGTVAGGRLARRYADADTCILELTGGPDPRPAPEDRLVPLAAATLRTSAGSDPAAVRDGSLATHWTDPVDPDREAWLAVDLGAPHRLTRVVLRFGPHFGEHLRAYRVELSNNGHDWIPAAEAAIAEPPLADLIERPHDLAQPIPLYGSAYRHLRLVRPVARAHGLDLDWGWWGIHELELYELQPAE